MDIIPSKTKKYHFIGIFLVSSTRCWR